ncbi:thiamine phosphate synthase [Belnapia rosea]|uniref:Thiamine-phosphate pyrophosphorylase n=1 Tax=Belnapia rosea TaxID=938405 RepID=A0A1G6QJY9_9PROT|nr:thiamine phosphate synthase [Belnapia rosea]SDB64463.1 thiamine-phosphate pyrophosphorylase [Belnapia rosea]SDC91987.1 thiamine-phosphate pyrophosphorylase [Belnapia rosea]
MGKLEAAARRLKPWGGPRLVLVGDPVRLPDPRGAAARLPAGAAVLARGLSPAVLRGLAALARQRRLVLLVGGDGRLALRHGAGLHVPDRRAVAGLLPFLQGRRRRGLLLTAAAHGRAGLARARRLRADAVLLSPVFPTRSHPGAPALGPLRWAALARRAGRPVLGLGGIGGPTAGRLPRWAAGLAAIEGFLPL